MVQVPFLRTWHNRDISQIPEEQFNNVPFSIGEGVVLMQPKYFFSRQSHSLYMNNCKCVIPQGFSGLGHDDIG